MVIVTKFDGSKIGTKITNIVRNQYNAEEGDFQIKLYLK